MMRATDAELGGLFKLTKKMLCGKRSALVGDYMGSDEVGLTRLMVKGADGYSQVASWNPDGKPVHGWYFHPARIKIALHDLRRELVLEVLSDL